MRKTSFLLLLFLVISCLGCSTITAKKVGPNEKVDGIRYWLSAPYLMVQAPVEVKRTETLYRVDLNADDHRKLKLVPMEDEANPTGGAAGHAALYIDRKEPLGQIVLAASTKPPTAGGGLPGQLPPADAHPGGTGTNPSPPTATPGAGGGTGVGGSDTPPSGKDTPPATPPANAVSIVWLPDYCEQYALQQTNVLSTSKLKVDLGDGWKLSGLDSTLDSTTLLGKVLDLAGSVVGAGKGGGSGSGTGSGGGSAGGSNGAGNLALHGSSIVVYLRKVDSISLRPGLYPLTEHSGGVAGDDSCDKRAHYKFPTNITEASTTWTVVPASVKWP